MFNVITTRTSAPSGAGRVIAKGRGKQRTHKWDLSKSADWNHGTAAGTLLLALGHDDSDWPITHDSDDSGNRHVFTVQDAVVGS